MSADFSKLIAVLGKMEAADLAILGSDLVSALEALAISELPVGYQMVVGGLLSDVNPALNSALSALLKKVPVLGAAPAAPAAP